MRPEIAQVLDDLKRRIRRYVVIEGIAAVMVIAGVLFWISLGTDVAWFKISRLELPLLFRRAFLLLFLGLTVVTAASWIAFRMLRSYRAKALALVLERRFPELDDRLVTAVELSEAPSPTDSSLSNAMLEQTVQEAVRTIESVDLGSVFDSRPLRRAVVAATVLAVSILGFSVTNADAMERWYQAYIIGRSDYWDPFRKSEMTVQVLAQPGDRVRDFSEENTYKHPRGADLTILVTVKEGKEVPGQVSLKHRSYGPSGHARGAVSMSRIGDRQFRHTIGRVIDTHELWVVGGDYTNRRPFFIEIVDPPKVDRIELDCDYPSYTGMDSLETKPLMVQGANVSLPMETRFTLRAWTNKPLKSIRIRCDHFLLEAARDGQATLAISHTDSTDRSTIKIPDHLAREFFQKDARLFALPMVMSTSSAADLQALAESTEPKMIPLPFPPDTKLQIYLEDTDDILSFDPATLTINGTPDMPPVVDSHLRGVGNQITRLATIPIERKITDDYGVMSAWFSYRLDASEELLKAEFENPPLGQQEYPASQKPSDLIERFDVVPLQLDVGRRLTLSVRAIDGDTFNGPHEAEGQVFSFEIVSEDDLLQSLYDKEMNLRLRFEHIREELDGVRTDLLLHRGRHSDGVRLQSNPPDDQTEEEIAAELEKIHTAVQACADRSLHLLRKNHSESREIEQRFRDVREEMVNNRVDTKAALDRLDDGIIRPMATLNEQHFPGVDEQLGLFSLTVERGKDPLAVLDDSIAEFDQLIALIDQIIAQMQERKGFNEVIQELQNLLKRQKKVLEETKKDQLRKDILGGDLFN